jgi:hypothetical protein
MGLPRLVRRHRGASVVVLGAAVSIGVVAMTASGFSWRRTKAEPEPEAQEPRREDAEKAQPDTKTRWDTPPAELEPPQVESPASPPSP